MTGNSQTATIVRYVRNLDERHYNSNLGGITLIFALDYNKKTVDVSFSICNSKENFNKKLGIEAARAAGVERRLPYQTFKKLADVKGGFVHAYIAILEVEQVMYAVSEREKQLLKKYPGNKIHG